MNVLAIGASRNIGYYAAVRLLEKGANVTFLLRSPTVFDADTTIQRHLTSGSARLVKGDALKKDDVQSAWKTAEEASAGKGIDLVLFTVGGMPSFSLTKGFTISPPDLCTHALLILLSIMPPTGPRLITISSTGLSRASHAALPLPLKPMYGYLLHQPHADKLGAERIVAHCAGWEWKDEEPSAEILPEGWQRTEGLIEPGKLKHVVVVRPALLTDGACKADGATKFPYRAAAGELKGSYTVSRKDVAHFLVEGILPQWDQWEGKRVSIAY